MSQGSAGPANAVAVIGMAGRFPGAATVTGFWRNLCEGVESIDTFTDAELEDTFGPEVRGAPNFVRARPILPDVDRFDAEFFGMRPREAELTDPQHRVLLECAWEAFEDAGYDPAATGPVGVFAGCSMNTYFLANVAGSRAVAEDFTNAYQVGQYPMLVGASQDFLATRLSYKLDLRGPSLTVHTACSTSLTAIAQACQALLLYGCDMALAGGVSITFPQRRGYLSQEGGMVSEDGHCRPFDARANGTVFGSGAGLVLLKRLEDAVADRDHIYAVVRGCGVNNDGAGKMGFTAPSPDGQAAAIAMAHAAADVDPATIGYVECHGTATPLGDPIEVAGLKKAFGADGRQAVPSCALGSVKGNVGHLDAAAGVTGFIKTALALESGILPPTLHFETPNPRLELAGSPFHVQAALGAWPAGTGPRRAGVSAFGVGGTNVHVVLEQPPVVDEGVPAPAPGAGPELLVLSARSAPALARARAALAERLREDPSLPLADVAHTLQVGRRPFGVRWAAACADRDQAMAALGAGAARTTMAAPSVVFMFPGQGSQHLQMGRGLYDAEPVFRREIDRCARLLSPLLDRDLRALLYPKGDGEQAVLSDTRYAQPAIFAVEHALACLWMSWGVRPRAMIGHSIGEFVAACLAGVMTVDEALPLVAERGRLMQALPGGAMLSVRLPEAELAPILEPDVAIAAVNAPTLCVAAGPSEAIARLEAALAARSVACRRLHTSHAFHSAMMDPVIEPFTNRVREVELREPALPYVSGVSGTWITPEAATSPDYWARHFREPVRFAAGLAPLLDEPDTILLEVGPGRSLTTLALQGAAKGGTVLASLPDAARERDDRLSMLDALGRLWSAGVEPDWSALRGNGTPRRVPLPTYPFERQRHWIDAPPAASRGPAAASGPAPSLPTPPLPTPPLLNQPLPGTPSLEPTMTPDRPEAAAPADHASTLRRDVVAILEELSGEDVAGADPGTTFLEMGFDSLFLTQVSQALLTRFGIKVTFRQLLGDLDTVAALSAHLAASVPPAATAPVAPVPATLVPAVPPTPVAPSAEAPARAVPVPVTAAQAGPPLPADISNPVQTLLRDQLQVMAQLMQQQLAILGGTAPAAVENPPASLPAVVPQPKSQLQAPPAPPPAPADTADPGEGASRFRVYRPVRTTEAGLDARQQAHVAALAERYGSRMATSKRMTQQHRRVLADPRAVSGFTADWKEMVFPVVAARSKGSKIWDADGNQYVDLVNGYGQTMFGHAPDFVVEAVERQLREGFAIGPQSALTGEVAELFCELTGNERVTFCNTGSEAVMAAMRVARTVTGRRRVVMFSGDYHGQFDEVLVRGVGRGEPRSLPVAPGIPPQSVENVTVLDYGSPEALAWIRAHASEIAAVVVEPVQSRHPALQPREFLAELRAVTAASGTALVFDEVVTGFRMHPGGMQAVFGIRADLATYGKVVGGGMPVGILAGAARFMDALDGGHWSFGDDSYPEVGVTFFAGTFVRHPLTMAAVLAVLRHLKAQGPALQERLTARMAGLVADLRALFRDKGLNAPIETCGSLFYFAAAHEERLGSLLYYHLRARGIYIQEGFPCFLTTAHSDEDLAAIRDAFRESLDAMRADGILKGRPAIEEAGAAASAAPKSGDVAPQDTAPQDTVPTTSQTEIWLSAQLGDEASCAFNESVSLRLGGPLDPDALAAALDAVVARHDALRASFDAAGTVLRFAPALALDLPLDDLTAAADPEQALRDLIAEDARTPFDLVRGPLVRARLARLAPDRHVLVLTAHHIVCDGWSFAIILGEVAALYRARRSGAEPVLGPVLPFSTYAGRSRTAPGLDRDEAYWLDQFAAASPPLELPTDRPRPAVKTFRGGTHTETIDGALTEAVRRAGAKRGCTLFATLLAGFDLLMGRLSGQREVVVGIPSAGQSLLEGEESLVGHCVNLLPLRAAWDDLTPFSAFLAATKRSVLDAYEHRSCTLGTLLRRLDPPRDPSRLPLAEVQFNLERQAGGLDLPGLSVELASNPKAFSTFDLFFNLTEVETGLRLDCDYNADLFDAATIARWVGHYRVLLAAVAADMDQPVGLLPLTRPGEPVASLAGPVRALPEDGRPLTIHGLVAAQAARTPAAPAVTFQDVTLTYAELDEGAERLAAYLGRCGIAPGARVGVLVERSLDMLLALLGILKAGCAYVPLAPNHPRARLASILAEADVAGLVTQSAPMAALAPMLAPTASPVIVLDRVREQIAATPRSPAGAADEAADTLAYVIFTSGSTGAPKGVEVTHRSVANFLASMAREPGLDASDHLLAVTTVAFDIAALELYLPLAVGAHVTIAPQPETADGFALLERLRASGVTTMQATPITWRMLLEAGFRSAPGFKMLCGGEALPRDLADALLAGGGELWNMYGPTETTIWSSVARVLPGPAPVTIGAPIDNTQFHVLDPMDRPVPPGVLGQLHIGGEGVARGYFRRPDLTAEKFIADPLGPAGGGRLYRTGDLARMAPDGSVHLAGRTDHQVKLRGFRIELGEIEGAIAKAGLGVNAVVLREDVPGEPRLVAYVEAPASGTAAWSAREADALRAVLARDLPDYMIPSQWVRLDRLPLGPSGKLDRRSLPPPGPAVPDGPRVPAAPRTPAEATLARICADVLHRADIGVEDDLLGLGADSIHLFHIVAHAQQAGLALSARELLQHRTIAACAAFAQDGEGRQGVPLLAAIPRAARRSAMQPAAGASQAPIAMLARKEVS